MRAMALMAHYGILRSGDYNLSASELSDYLTEYVAGEGPTPCNGLVFITYNGKAN